MDSIFNYDLVKLAKDLKEEFISNEPFPYLEIKNLFNEDVLSQAVEEIKDTQAKSRQYRDKNQIKDLVEGRALIQSSPENIRKVFTALNSDYFTTFLRDITDIPDLFPDDTFRGGGIHHIPQGGKLGIHIDFSRPSWDSSVYRRANVLLYLNKDWQEEWGGHLELWDKSVRSGGQCIKKISPEFNTLALFGTQKASWHGHPTPLQCPKDRARQSFAAYYYSKHPSDDLQEHSTVFN